ncbi:MAG: hypothetical protein WBV82_15485, partial [Myxococcaceae bacterium]
MRPRAGEGVFLRIALLHRRQILAPRQLLPRRGEPISGNAFWRTRGRDLPRNGWRPRQREGTERHSDGDRDRSELLPRRAQEVGWFSRNNRPLRSSESNCSLSGQAGTNQGRDRRQSQARSLARSLSWGGKGRRDVMPARRLNLFSRGASVSATQCYRGHMHVIQLVIISAIVAATDNSTTACSQGGHAACLEAASAFLSPKPTERDPERAMSLLQLACDGGYGPACTRWAQVREELSAEIPEDAYPCEVKKKPYDDGPPAFVLACDKKFRQRHAFRTDPYERACELGDEAGCRKQWKRFPNQPAPRFASESKQVRRLRRFSGEFAPIIVLDASRRVFWSVGKEFIGAFDAETGRAVGSRRPSVESLNPHESDRILDAKSLGPLDLRVLILVGNEARVWHPLRGVSQKLDVPGESVCAGALADSGERVVLSLGGMLRGRHGSCHSEAEGARLATFEVDSGTAIRVHEVPSPAYAVATNHHGTVVAAASDAGLLVADEEGARSLTHPGKTERVRYLSMDSGGKVVFAQLRWEGWVWTKWNQPPRRFGQRSGMLLPDGKHLVMLDSGEFGIWNIEKDRWLEAPVVIGPPDYPTSDLEGSRSRMQVSRDGRTISFRDLATAVFVDVGATRPSGIALEEFAQAL